MAGRRWVSRLGRRYLRAGGHVLVPYLPIGETGYGAQVKEPALASDTNDTNSTATRHRHDTDRRYRGCATA
jgi:hypothetical protein